MPYLLLLDNVEVKRVIVQYIHTKQGQQLACLVLFKILNQCGTFISR